MEITQFFGYAERNFCLPINVIVGLIFKLFALSALVSGISVPEKERTLLDGKKEKKEPEGEDQQDDNSKRECACVPKGFFTATAKIRATDREGNSIEIIY